LAGAYAISNKATKLYYGAHAGDHAIYPDCRAEFIDAMKVAFLLCDWSLLRLEAPYWAIDKGDIVMIGTHLGVDYSLTHTCYNAGPEACGKCGSCTERLEGFKKAGLIDPVVYKGL